MTVTQSFSTPVVEIKPDIHPEMFANWQKTLTELSESLIPSKIGNNKVFESPSDFFYWDSPVNNQIASICHLNLAQIVSQVSDLSQQEFEKLIFDYLSWIQVFQNEGFAPCQNFPNSSWTGYLCIDSIPKEQLDSDNGVILLHDPRVNANQHQDHINSRYRWPTTHCAFKLQPQPGDMVIFPSYMQLESFTYLGDTPRIMVWFNAWIRDPQALHQQPKERYKPREVKPFVFDY